MAGSNQQKHINHNSKFNDYGRRRKTEKLEADMQNVIAAKDKEIEELKKQLEEAKKQPEDDADDEYAEELVEKLSAK